MFSHILKEANFGFLNKSETSGPLPKVSKRLVERLSVFSQLTARANHRLLPAEFLRTRELG